MDNKVIEMSKAGCTQVYISKELGMCRKKIRKILRDNDMPTKVATTRTLTCEFCEKKFETVSPKAKYCSDTCRNNSFYHIERECLKCGKMQRTYSTAEEFYCANCPRPSRATVVYVPVPKIKKECIYCAKTYIGTEKGTDYCSSSCGRKHYRERNPGKFPDRRTRKRCIECDRVFMGTDRKKYCCVECGNTRANRIKGLRRREKMYENGTVDENITLDELIIRDGNICHLCGTECDKEDYKTVDGYFVVGEAYPSIDHVLPISKGGVHQWNNVKLAHHRCNTIKGNNTSNNLETAAE